MRFVSMVVVALFSVAPFSAIAAPAEFIKKPTTMGSRVSTVTTFSVRNRNSGPFLQCQGTCFSDHVTRHWRCEIPSDNTIVHCHLNCSPPPPRGECLFE